MTMSFYEDIQNEIRKSKKELLHIISIHENTDIEKDTQLYSDFISKVGKLTGKIEGLELSITIYNKYKKS